MTATAVPARRERPPARAVPWTRLAWSYQPATRWWQLQLTEGAWLLAASLLLITATILLIRRRPA
jgi:hypothetical protein